MKQFNDGLEKLREKVNRFFTSQKASPKILSKKILRFEAVLPRLNLRKVLTEKAGKVNIFWSSRDYDYEIIGFGKSNEYWGNEESDFTFLFKSIHEDLKMASPETKYFGGIRFDHHSAVDEHWRGFPAFRFWLPRIEIFRQKKQTKVALNIFTGNEFVVEDELKKIDSWIMALIEEKGDQNSGEPTLIERFDYPDRQAWINMIQSALIHIDRQDYQKVVLARKTVFKFNNEINGINILKQLLKNNPNVFHFYFKFEDGSKFLGATPELLLGLKDQLICSEAIAGTCTRGVSEQQDQLLSEELLKNVKEIQEHRWVSDRVFHLLKKYCQSVEVLKKETVLRLLNVQHIYSQFRGKLNQLPNFGNILRELHPTPAVGGVPKDVARQTISALEPFDRGWYAGPVGWIGQNSAEIAVAIRSALVYGKEINIYAGAGIVKGSDPEKEWDEVEKKMLNFIQIFN